MFQKSIIGIALIVSSVSTLAAPELPFVGKREFNFGNGNATVETIKISKTGSFVMRSCGMPLTCTVSLKGQYKALIPDGYGGYYKFTANKVYLLNRNGEIKRDCLNNDSGLCVADLFKE